MNYHTPKRPNFATFCPHFAPYFHSFAPYWGGQGPPGPFLRCTYEDAAHSQWTNENDFVILLSKNILYLQNGITHGNSIVSSQLQLVVYTIFNVRPLWLGYCLSPIPSKIEKYIIKLVSTSIIVIHQKFQ